MTGAAPPARQGPLAHVTVLDLTRVMSGPYCTMMLGDMGARVIKIEHRGRGDDTRHWGPPFQAGESSYFLSVNRNKESVTLDFRTTGGRRILEELLARSDVMVENFRPDTLSDLELGYETLAARHPRLIYCSISGYGHTGPRRTEPGYDAVLQAEGGLMSISGEPDGPPARLGVPIVDIVSGMFAAQGIVLALLARERTNRGQAVDISMLDSVAALLTYQAGAYFATSVAPVRVGNRHPLVAPYGVFSAADGEFVLAIGNDAQWQAFCELAGLDALASDPRFATNPSRIQRPQELESILGDRLKTRSRQQWIDGLLGRGVPCGSIRTVAEVLVDRQLNAREMIETLDHEIVGSVRTVGNPIKLSDTPGAVRTAAPVLGKHTESVLQELGFSRAEIEQFRRSGAI
jgi:crotonobetainyl-CoA:carnitine CoA-transferase CaiB-like acyl-CoA transferase